MYFAHLLRARSTQTNCNTMPDLTRVNRQDDDRSTSLIEQIAPGVLMSELALQ